MATNIINFKVGFTKAKIRKQVHQTGRLQQIIVQHAKTYYHIITRSNSKPTAPNETVSQHSPLSRGSGLRDCFLVSMTWHCKTGIWIRPRVLGAWDFIGITGSQDVASGILERNPHYKSYILLCVMQSQGPWEKSWLKSIWVAPNLAGQNE